MAAAILYLLELVGVLRLVRRRLWPRLRRPISVSPRFLSAGRTLIFAGLMLTLSLGFVQPLWAKGVVAFDLDPSAVDVLGRCFC